MSPEEECSLHNCTMEERAAALAYCENIAMPKDAKGIDGRERWVYAMPMVRAMLAAAAKVRAQQEVKP